MEVVLNTLQENITHGESMFQVGVYANKHINPTVGLYSHWHEEIEIMYVEKGPFLLHVNGEIHTANTGDLFFINSHDLHHAQPCDDVDSVHHAIVFNLNLLKSNQFDSCQQKYIDPILNGTTSFPLHLDGHSTVGQRIIADVLEIISLYETNPYGWEIAIKKDLLDLLVELIISESMVVTPLENTKTKNAKLQLVKKGIFYLQNHYSEKVNLGDVASHLSISNEYFCRLFKSMTGKTPIEYLNNYRVEQALQQLRGTNKSILEVGIDCGFDNPSYFIKKFKEQKGITPKQFQMNCLKRH